MLRADDDDGFGEAYAADDEVTLLDAHDERPAVLRLAGDVRGHRVLDADLSPEASPELVPP